MFKISLEEIERAVRGKLHESDKELVDSHYLDAAIYRTLKDRRGETSEELSASAAQLAMELRDGDQSVELRQTATDRIFGDALVRALAPTIEGLREREFGKPEPPFATVEEASGWIEARSKDPREWKKSEDRKQPRDEIRRLAHEHQIEISFEFTLLPYQVPNDEHVKWVQTDPGTYLHVLAKETDRIAKRTGLPQDALVIHVLTGLKPVRSRARITTRESDYTLPSGEQIYVNEAVVTFRARDLTDKELRDIYRTVKGHVGGKGTKPLDEKDEHLWTLVQKEGGPSRRHGKKGPFWQAILEKFDRKYPGEITTRRGIEIRYDRISKRLQPPREA